MVVVSVALCSKSGQYLLARQFIEISRIRIEGLLAAFPKLLNTGKEHTFVETDQVRYVYVPPAANSAPTPLAPNISLSYQPLEDLYLLLITNKSSNIVEDLETLRLMARVVPEFCPDLTDAGVTAQARQWRRARCCYVCVLYVIFVACGFGCVMRLFRQCNSRLPSTKCLRLATGKTAR
jgi:hypothetical protein